MQEERDEAEAQRDAVMVRFQRSQGRLNFLSGVFAVEGLALAAWTYVEYLVSRLADDPSMYFT